MSKSSSEAAVKPRQGRFANGAGELFATPDIALLRVPSHERK